LSGWSEIFMCSACGKREIQWCGYKGMKDGFCESCKEKWIIFAGSYGVRFGLHKNTFEVKDGHSAHAIFVPPDVNIEELWDMFVSKKIYKRKLVASERVEFT
jgi:hypothetical protein